MNELFSVKDQIILITGGYGVLGSNVAKYLATQGATSIIIGRSEQKGQALMKTIESSGGKADFFQSDVLDVKSLSKNNDAIIMKYGRIDALVNVAGGNVKGATLTPEQSIFDMKLADWDKVVDLNLNGTVYPTLIFGKTMATRGKGSVVNITSMATYSAITRVLGYSVAKTGISSFTQWMAMEMALKFGDKIRVNAIAPGFFIGEQNKGVLVNPDGSLSERSRKILTKTPMKRFGNISELNGAVQFLCSEAASFITGAIIPVDGGFSSFSGI
ncbi:SDR family oxidoreductase [Parabacteroides sp. Marseille-P3160]|uniref:SDR family oxidoreductase n=1 Tax=Parabacteroides sp. Marseille-P3160 TaxID=1917887 RepID=UPI0009BAD85F|nr:SDR family oxidoreductase [Parabacteroides sp. Marseille-P3160]